MNHDEILLGMESTLMGFFYNRTQDQDLSREFYHELWIRLREQQEKGISFDSVGRFRGWIFKVAGGMVVDHYRRANRSSCRILNADDVGVIRTWRDPDPSVEDLIIHQEMLEEAAAGVRMLPDHWRFVYEMHVLGGMKFREICLITGESLGAVLGHMRYCRKRLKKNI